MSVALSPLPYPGPDHAVSFFEAEQQVSIWGELGKELRQSGKAGCVAKLFSRHIALTLTAGASVSDRETHSMSGYLPDSNSSSFYRIMFKIAI